MTLVRQKTVGTRAGWSELDSARLEHGLEHLGLEASPAQRLQLRSYGQLLLKWNGTYNLLGATTAAALVEDHLLDSLAVLPALERWVPPSQPVLMDIGSGAGLPGIVLAIMQKSLRIALVEPNGKKAAFLRQAAAVCHLRGIKVIESRIEALGSEGALEGWWASQPRASAETALSDSGEAAAPHFICRAFTSLSRFAVLSRPHLRKGSLILAMKAARVSEELAELEPWVEVLAVEALRPAAKDVQRNLVVMRSKPP